MSERRLAYRLLAGATAVGITLAPLVAEAKCLTAPQSTATQVRLLQTELMVAALSCRSVQDRNFLPQYNEFIRIHGDRLNAHSKVLQGYFNEAYGKAGQTRMDKFVTSIANDSSTRSMQTTTYCDDAVALFTEIVAVKRTDLEEYSRARIGAPTVLAESCVTTATAAAPATPRK